MPDLRRIPKKIVFAPLLAAASLLILAFAEQPAKPQAPPETSAKAAPARPSAASSAKIPFAGSKTCYDCHAKFYDLWSTSRHGLAMQTYSPEFAKKELQPQADDVVIGKRSFRAEIGEKEGWVREKEGDKETRYPIAQVMGGKNVYYFLTQMPQGRLQVLPVAYDVHKRAWYDTTASGVRHFPDRRQVDEALPWTDRLFTFNTTCFDCHVSQLATNYDLKTDTYRTTWREAGISCESCHGPGGEHVAAMDAGVKGHTSKDIKIIRTLEFSHQRMNDMCATCHAKLVPLSTEFLPGEKFYDHYDLITLEHPDFYPDGRDLGENYTFTSWSMSPCLKSDKLDCNQCHTPSGRPRFEGKQANQSCLPCHAAIVADPTAHSHHQAESTGNSCAACHMPMSRFAAMARTDHSMRPPMPAATIAYKSPNACNQCHADHDAAWADQWVRKWYPRDYQAEPLRRAALLDAGRKNDWQRLAEMLADVEKQRGDEIYRNALVRLLRGCSDAKKWPVLIAALKDDSPLVRASAAAALDGYLTRESLAALLRAAADPVRLVRIRAAAALASVPPQRIDDPVARLSLQRAAAEFKKAMQSRPDDWASYSNLGSYLMESEEFEAAAAAFETALKLEPRVVGPMVNLSMAYANLKQNDKAEALLRQALKAEPENAPANFNLGLLLAETNRMEEAEKALRAALKSDPQLAPAAFNLAVILGEKKDLAGAVEWCRKAHDLQPEEAKYTESLVYYLTEKRDTDGAIAVLQKAIQQNPRYFSGSANLAGIYESRGDRKAAARVLRDAMQQPGFPPSARGAWQKHVEELEK
jgi:Flp pilus assembly protein TadD